MKQVSIIFFLLIFSVFTVSLPKVTSAADNFIVSGWIPYWADTTGIKSAKKQAGTLDMIFPFVYTITSNGELYDNAGMDSKLWKSYIKSAQQKGISVVPTIMTGDGELVHTLLSDAKKRKQHIEYILEAVEEGKYDGIDIDYEGKKSATIDDFSLFLKELKKALGSKILACTLEARTPPESLYKEVPEVINYANDYTEIAQHCDFVEIMAYDQQRADLLLNKARAGEPYFPVADPDWVEKVIELAVEDIPREKILLGIPTYGRHMEVTVSPDWFQSYAGIGAVNKPLAEEIAKEQKVKASRNAAGELSFTYIPKHSPVKDSKKYKVPKGIAQGHRAALLSLEYANKTGKSVPVRLVWYSDAAAIYDKVELAHKHNLAGVALFKIDGEEDQKLWKLLR